VARKHLELVLHLKEFMEIPDKLALLCEQLSKLWGLGVDLCFD
jgi:hypothetical protein